VRASVAIPLTSGVDDVDDDEDLVARDQSGPSLGPDDARVIADFGVGSFGAGPVAGFAAADFFPVPADADPVLDDPRAGAVDAGSP
jgi:hypothetical protein